MQRNTFKKQHTRLDDMRDLEVGLKSFALLIATGLFFWCLLYAACKFSDAYPSDKSITINK